MNAKEHFGARLKRARSTAGMSQLQLANAMGMHPGTVGWWETGRSLPSLPRAVELAGVLDLSMDDLFVGVDLDVMERPNGGKKA